ncbi:Gar1/Naf1 family protein [Natronomonas sp. F2-12]|jgi:RNA-binding protein|uniref:Gar1/Naf1 family protein n=1 Tax=Natronomonas aquatica TaxID=2841590 RepID=A0A9R1D7G0_9EURY|nr:Gar1/Naf1 family protein [Natronomonas aquatica]MCQ4333310.1 Gar1/Naf1 family protein [Natronomonas aquatica]
MRRVGEVVRTAQGLAIVRSPDGEYPDLGTEVVDQDLETVGRIVDVFGPADRPYVAVSPADEITMPALLGEKLYAR